VPYEAHSSSAMLLTYRVRRWCRVGRPTTQDVPLNLPQQRSRSPYIESVCKEPGPLLVRFLFGDESDRF
jgi:hypothetical protein